MRTSVLALAPVLVLGLVGCGTNPAEAYKNTDPTTIATQAHAALKATTSLHVTGTVQFGTDSVTVDLSSDLAGALTGTATIDGATVQILGTGGKNGVVYVKASQDFWGKITPQYAGRLVGKWVSDVQPLPANLEALSLPKLIKNEDTYPWEKEQPTLVGTGSVQGTPTVQISVTDGSGGAAELLEVDANDPHHVVKESEGSSFTLTFDGFGAAVTATPPPAASVVDFTKIVAQK